MNSYQLEKILAEAEELQQKAEARQEKPAYSTTLKHCAVCVPKLVIDGADGGTFSNHADEPGRSPDTLKLAPAIARRLWQTGQIIVTGHLPADVYYFGEQNPLEGFKPWIAEGEKITQKDGRELVWIRCRLTRMVSLGFDVYEPHTLSRLSSFYLPWHFIRSGGVTYSLEDDDDPYRKPLQICVPQAL